MNLYGLEYDESDLELPPPDGLDPTVYAKLVEYAGRIDAPFTQRDGPDGLTLDFLWYKFRWTLGRDHPRTEAAFQAIRARAESFRVFAEWA